MGLVLRSVRSGFVELQEEFLTAQFGVCYIRRKLELMVELIEE